ncbi:ABC transporter permease [Rhodococcus sp. MS16]|nr:ABC transporter permease [Rhodococcus sp. MS16]
MVVQTKSAVTRVRPAMVWPRLALPLWVTFTLKKVFHLTGVLLGVTFLVSVMLSFLPGDAARAILGDTASDEQVAVVRADLGLDKSVLARYWDWLAAALHGDLGTSYRTGEPVWDALMERLPVSIELMVLVQVFALGVAIVLALWVTYRPDGWLDKITSLWAFGGISIPHFVLALGLIYFFSVSLGWLPASGFVPFAESPSENLKYMALPALALAMEPAAVYLRLLRNDLRTSLGEEYVLAVQAKGMSSFNILVRQMLRPSSFSMVTLAGINTARLIGSAVVIETIFALPGLGRLLVDSVTARDFVMIQALVAVIAVIYVVVNALIDLIYLFLDPRVRA